MEKWTLMWKYIVNFTKKQRKLGHLQNIYIFKSTQWCFGIIGHTWIIRPKYSPSEPTPLHITHLWNEGQGHERFADWHVLRKMYTQYCKPKI